VKTEKLWKIAAGLLLIAQAASRKHEFSVSCPSFSNETSLLQPSLIALQVLPIPSPAWRALPEV
jgi:hypothetical protein